MNQKYEKPVARNLGEMIPNAQGYCLVVGNSANLPLPGSSCKSGASATGATCAYGGEVNPQACNSGTTPKYFGCINGDFADPAPCNVGNGVY